MSHGDPDGGPLRLAIVGLGPKGLFALERLLDQAHRIGRHVLIDVDLFEPHPVAGAGPVYDPGQPEYLRMNFAAERLDMWPADSRVVPAAQRLSFVDWRRAAGGANDPYPPRAHVGRYLSDGLERMCHHAPPWVSITLRATAVRALERHGCTWRIASADGATYDYDEILLTVGHGTAIDHLAGASDAHAAPLVGGVFPVTSRLSPARVPPGSVVAVRGFALTFLDATLALTEGRGGLFESDGHPHRLRYSPAAADAGTILPFSRTGRPMLAKPEPGLAAAVPALDAITHSGGEQIRALPEAFSVKGELIAMLAATTAGCLLAANGARLAGEPLRRARAAAGSWLAAAADGASPPAGRSPAAELERSLAVGAGLRAPDLPWALGHTWRGVYPALVQRLGAAGMADRQWPAFRRLAAQMERVSFGPPAINAAKLLALIDVGRVDLTHVAAGHIVSSGASTSIRSAQGERPVDIVVNAVLAAPGARHADGGLLEQLVAGGHARMREGRRGLDVRADAAAFGPDGRPTPGLSVIGRASEDCVIGNDTLSRTLHPQADRWALRVARRATHQAAAA